MVQCFTGVIIILKNTLFTFNIYILYFLYILFDTHSLTHCPGKMPLFHLLNCNFSSATVGGLSQLSTLLCVLSSQKRFAF